MTNDTEIERRAKELALASINQAKKAEGSRIRYRTVNDIWIGDFKAKWIAAAKQELDV